MLVLAKALPKKFAGQAGYVLINGRWKKASPDMKGTKNAPKAAHPKAGGTGHKPFAMPDQDVGKLLYPKEKEATNKDINHFNNKHVPGLLQHAAKGDAAAILGSSYGVNTHGKKLALIANFLLEMMGSKEQVVAGQKAGEHPAVLEYNREPENVEQMTEQAAEAVATEVKAEAKAEPEEQPTAEPAAPGELAMPAFESGKTTTGVRTAYEMQANKILSASTLADLEAVQTSAKSWSGKTPNSKKLLNLYGQALAKFKGENPEQPMTPILEPSPVAAVATVANAIAQPDTADEKPAPKANVAKKAMAAIDWDKFAVAENIKNAKSYNAQIDAIKAAGEQGDVNAIIGMTYGKNTYGLKVAKAANNALAALGYPDVKVVIGKDAIHPMLGQLSQAEADQKAIAQPEMEQDAKAKEGPQEGDTRMGKNGLQKLVNGRWVNAETGEESKEQPKAGEYKKGQKLTVHDMHQLPAGTVIQTFDKSGKPYLKVQLGHYTAWPFGKKGAVMAKPFQVGQYETLMGAGGTKPDSLGYVSGYHHSEYPTELVSLGDNMNTVSDAQGKTIKSMFSGVQSVMGDAGVYPTGASLILVGSPAKPESAIWVNEKGDWGGAKALGSYFQNDVYKDFMGGKEPALNIMDKLGLAKAEPVKVKNPPQTGNEFIDSTTETLQEMLNEQDWTNAVAMVEDMVTAIKGDAQMIDDFHKVDLTSWLIEAVTLAKKELGDASVTDLPTPPPHKTERVTTDTGPELPEFENVQEFDAWSEKNMNAFMEGGETHYGSDEAFAASEVGKKLDKWIDVSNATKASEAKATKHERKKEAPKDEYEMWESAFDKITDAGSISEATKLAADWLADNGDAPPQMFALSTALNDWGFKELATEYHAEASNKYFQWWEANNPGIPKKPVLSPTATDMQNNLNLQGTLNALDEQAKAGKSADLDIVDELGKKLGEMNLSDTGKAVAQSYLAAVKAKVVKDGPQEGDTKQGKGGTLVFHNGHWILQSDMPEISANGFAGSEITAFKQAIAGQNGDDVSNIAYEFLKDNHHYSGAYTTVIDNIMKMNDAHVYSAGEMGAQYFKKHGKPVNLPPKPPISTLYADDAMIAQGTAIAATLATDPDAKQKIIAGLQGEYDFLQGKTSESATYKAYVGDLLDALNAAPDKPKNVHDLSKVWETGDNLKILSTVNEYTAKKGESSQAYQDVVKAAGDNVQAINLLAIMLKADIQMNGMPKDMPKSSWTPDTMADADEMDSITAAGMVAKYTDSVEMKQAALEKVKQSAYSLTALSGIENMQKGLHAIETMKYVQDQITPPEEPTVFDQLLNTPDSKAEDVSTEQFSALMDHMSVIYGDDNLNDAQKKKGMTGASKQFLSEHNYGTEAVEIAKSVLKIYYDDELTGMIVKDAMTGAAKADIKAADDGPKEGDMKPGANGMLVLKNGHWVKAGPDEIPLPDWSDMGLTGYAQEYYAKVAENVKKGLKNGALKGVLMQKADGMMLAYSGEGGKVKISVLAQAPGKKALAQYISMLLLAHGKKLKLDWTPEHGTYAMSGVAAVMKGDASTSNPADNMMTADADVPVKKYQWKKKEPVSVDDWTVTGGNQGGSNEGMKMKDADGQEWYVKFPGNEEHAKAEVLTAKLYAAAGMSAQDAMIVTKDGKLAIASKWEDLKKAKTPAALAKAKGMLDGFAVDAWLGNWDVIGLNLDNVQLKGKEAHRVDAGGSLMFRAQGAKKDFGPEVTEIETLMDKSINPKSAAVFGGMTEADITASVAKVLSISDAKIAHMVNQFGPGDDKAKADLVKTLIQRKDYLANKYPEAAVALKKAKFNPEKLTSPPDFLNWGGSGSSGPSSKEFLNKANNDAAQAIWSAAQTGDIDAIRGLTAPTFNKDTGAKTGEVPVLDHPSQHINGYAKQTINQINAQMNGHDNEVFRIGGDHPLYSMHEEYKPDSWSGNSADKIGKLLVLGHPGVVDMADMGITKQTYKSGQLTTSTFAKQAQDVWAKLPNTQKQAVQAYTGSGYQQMNSGLWKGNPSAEAQAAAQALSEMGHEITPGTTIGRKFSLNSSDLAKLTASVGKVIMEPAIMSTSISPDVWSGNIHLKMTAGPGVKGLYAGAGSNSNGGSISHHTGEKEIILPPNTRLLILSVKTGEGADKDGFGTNSQTVVECMILPTA